MAQAIISRRGGGSGSGYVTITFNGVSALKRTDVAALSQARYYIAATTVGNYALFGGGDTYTGTRHSSTVDAYNTSLTRSTPTSLSTARMYMGATTVGNYALFGGGNNGNNLSTVDAYHVNLTRSTPTSLSEARHYIAATTVGGRYALFGGGNNGSGSSSVVDAYDVNLTRSTPTSLNEASYSLAATTVGGGYALFGGGNTESTITTAYSAGLIRMASPRLSGSKTSVHATNVGNYALFAGGFRSGVGALLTVDAINTSLILSTPTDLSQKRSGPAATIGDYALFSGDSTETVDAYDTGLTRSTQTVSSQVDLHSAATTVGGYAMFGGGYVGRPYYTSSAAVDAYSVNNKVQVYPGTKYKLGSMSSESTSSTMQEIETTAPITGYIKIKDATIN